MIYKIDYNFVWEGTSTSAGRHKVYTKSHREFIHATDAADALHQEQVIAEAYRRENIVMWRMVPSSVREELGAFLESLHVDVTICRTEDDSYGTLEFDDDDLDYIIEMVRGGDA